MGAEDRRGWLNIFFYDLEQNDSLKPLPSPELIRRGVFTDDESDQIMNYKNYKALVAEEKGGKFVQLIKELNTTD
ncbi:MAG: hypothetical protein RI573_11295, partial [Balneolaceae bacterium]|nr:hypothetical protein [Balneolaceae bacterium]